MFFLLAALIVIGWNGIISKAADNEISAEEQDNWIDEIGYYCLRASGLDMEETYYVSDAFSLQYGTTDDVRMYFVFCDERCVGEFLVNEPMESCAFFQAMCEDITEFYAGGVEIAIMSQDADHIYAIRSDNGGFRTGYGFKFHVRFLYNVGQLLLLSDL